MPRRDHDDIDPFEIDAETDDEPGGDDQVEAAFERVRRVVFSRRAVAFAIAFVVVVLAFLYGVVPQLPGLQDSLHRVKNDGDRTWLAAAFALEIVSYVAYIWLFRAVFIRKIPRVGWAGSYQIALAGVAASRLFGAGGAGGIALTFWAVRKAGMGKRLSVSYLVAFFVVLYGVFMIVLLLTGVLLRANVVPGTEPFGMTVIPSLFAATIIALFLLMLFVPGNIERLADRWAHGRGRMAAIGQKLVTVPALVGHGTRVALKLIRERDVGLLGAVGWWAADMAVLWACFKAFGNPPPLAVVIMGYCVGMIANVIPTPGGVGAVEGGMIGAYAAFGVPLSLATAAVLSYRFFAFILPTIPGFFAFVRLRRSAARWQEEDATIQSKVLPV